MPDVDSFINEMQAKLSDVDPVTYAEMKILQNPNTPIGSCYRVLWHTKGSYSIDEVHKTIVDRNAGYTGDKDTCISFPGSFVGFVSRFSVFDLRFIFESYSWPEITMDTEPMRPFPVDSLPPVIQDFVREVAESYQVPPEMVAMYCMGAISTVTQGKALVYLYEDWVEPINLYIMVAMASGERKSPVKDAVMQPLVEWQSQALKNLQGKIAEEALDLKILTKQLEAFTNKASDVTSAKKKKTVSGDITNPEAERMGAREEAKRLLREIRELEANRTASPKLFVSGDCTMEELGAQLNDLKVITILDDEARLFSIANGAYDGAVNVDLLLKGYSGNTYQADRRTRHEYVRKPAITIIQAIQPKTLVEVLTNDAFVGRGLPARFLYVKPKSFIGYRKIETEAVSSASKAKWADTLLKLLEFKPARDDEFGEYIPVHIKLDKQTRDAYIAFRHELESMRRPESILRANELLESWGNKLDGGVLRLAFGLHAAKNPDLCWTSPIELETMEAAICIARVLMDHELATFNLQSVSPMWIKAQRVAQEVVKRKALFVTVRQVHGWMRKLEGFSRADTIKAVFESLIEMGYMARVETVNREKTGGRPTSLYAVNPYLFLENEDTNHTKPGFGNESPAQTAKSFVAYGNTKPGFVSYGEVATVLDELPPIKKRGRV